MRFYRRRRRFRARPRVVSITHVPSSMNNGVTTNNASVFVFANAGAYANIGTAITTVATSLSNREQENTVGSRINKAEIIVSTEDPPSGILEYAIVKVERSTSVPALGTQLPTVARISSIGLQSALRESQPGRVVHYGEHAFAAGQPVTRRIRVNFAKFRMSTIRAGDYFILVVFNRSSGTTTLHYKARYKEIK